MAVLPLNTNLYSLKAQRRLGETTDRISKTFEKLSSGLRINSASDDAAGLAISTQLQSDTRVYTQGIRNVNDGVSALNIAQGSTQELSSVLQRLKELATQAANGTFSLQQRLALDKESYALTNEFNRIVATTKFNNQNLIDGTLDTLSIQAGYGTNGRVAFQLGEQLDYAQGLGTFGAGTSFGAASGGTGAAGLATGDVNGDGKLDVVTSSSSGSIEVKLGNGDGTFQAATAYTATNGSQEIKLVDVNGDGRLDILGAGDDGASTQLSVLLNNGSGTFGSATTYVLSNLGGGGGDSNLSVGDLNGDGVQDVVVTSYYAYAGKNVAVLLGRGNGTFQAGASYDTGQPGMRDTALGDLNGDGRLDIVTADGLGYLKLALGNGDGTFGSFTSIGSIPAVNSYVTLADLNQDGILDLAVASRSAFYLYTAFGRGDGTFGVSTSYVTVGVGNIPREIVAQDLNNDGYLDLTYNLGIGTFGVSLNNGDGTFRATTSYSTTGSSAGTRTAVGDFNGDGVPDVIRTNSSAAKFDLAIANTQDLSTIARLNLTTRTDALAALSYIDTAFNRVQAELGNIGSSQSRLSSALNTLTTSRDNFSAANSRIVDADIAEESANLVRNQILQQAGAAVLAQANAQPNLVLDLLKR